MTAGASVEDKRADDRRIKELRDFQRGTPANKRCFDCNEMMPQYVCVDFNTFVCTACSGIHREFGHRVKSISMSKFTETEVKNMLKYGGNEAAQKIWRAKHDANFRPNGGNDGERTRNFIRLTYIDKKWQYESPRASSRDEQPQRTGSGSTKKPVAATTDFFNSPTPASSTPSFDAFSQQSSQANNGGFSGFGDFSSFDKPKKQQNDFEDFGSFDSPKPAAAQSTGGFGDFGGFSAKPAAAPPLRDEFKTGSFTLAPPPGSDFGAFGASSTPASFAAPPAPVKTASGGGNDFLAFSPVNNSKPAASNDPFGFANSPVAASRTNSQKAATPFDAFGSPGGTSAGRSSFDAFGAAPAQSSSSSFDAFGGGAPSPSGFNAFGATSQAATPASPGFGAFNSASTAAPTPSFDAFGTASSTTKTSSSSSFDAFGSASSPASAFGGFTSASSSSRTNSGAFGSPARAPAAAPANPFSPFGARTSSGSKASEPPKATAGDPFSAFDEVEAAPAPMMAPTAPATTGSVHDAFGSMSSSAPRPSGQNHGSFGKTQQPFGQAQQYAQTPSHFTSSVGGHPAPPADPFAFPGSAPAAKTNSFSNTSMGAPAKTGSFSGGAAGPQPGFGGPAAFGSFGQAPQQPTPGAFGQQPPQGHGFPPQQQQQQHFQQQQQQQQFQQQQMYQQQAQFGQYPAQGFAGQPGIPPQQQQQQWGQPPNAGAFSGGQFPPHQVQPQQMGHGSQPNAPAPAAPPKAEPASLKDPFSSLSLGSFGVSSAPSTSTSNPASRGNSFGKPTGSPLISATSSFSNPASASSAVPSHFGAVGGMGFGMGTPAPSSTGGSRVNSFEANKPSFPGATNSSTPSPMASFSMPSNSMSSAPPSAFGASSPSPMGSFAFPAQNTTPQKNSSFGDANAFGSFGAPPRTDSLKQSAPPAASSSNPFDMF